MTYETATATCNVNYWESNSIRVVKETTPDHIIDAACSAFNMTRERLLSKCSKREIVRVRYLSMHLIKEKTELSLKKVGAIFNTDHTTVLRASRFIKNELSVTAYRQQMNHDLNAIIERL